MISGVDVVPIDILLKDYVHYLEGTIVDIEIVTEGKLGFSVRQINEMIRKYNRTQLRTIYRLKKGRLNV